MINKKYWTKYKKWIDFFVLFGYPLILKQTGSGFHPKYKLALGAPLINRWLRKSQNQPDYRKKSGGNMKNRRKLAVLLVGLAILVFATPVTAAKTTITGKVSYDMTFQTQDGTVYSIAQDDMGDTVMVYAGKTVQITGKVKTKKGKKILYVHEFKVMK